MLPILRRARLIDRRITVAATTEPQDDAIVRLCDRLGIASFRRSEGDVPSCQQRRAPQQQRCG
jgi:spore coat polysaccharide biosynthesis protein SpsF (cytidylyltransferase family)